MENHMKKKFWVTALQIILASVLFIWKMEILIQILLLRRLNTFLFIKHMHI